MNIFMCGITGDTDECNTDFAMMVMTLPFEIEGHNLHVCFERSFEKAFAFAQSASVQYDRVIVIRATKSNKAFVQRAIKHGENRLIYGVYGMPTIHWDRLAQGRAACDYNIPDAILDKPRTDDGYVPLVARDIAAIRAHCEYPYDVISLDGRMLNALPADVRVWDLGRLPEAVKAAADVSAPLTGVGRVGFQGSIAMRGQVR